MKKKIRVKKQKVVISKAHKNYIRKEHTKTFFCSLFQEYYYC